VEKIIDFPLEPEEQALMDASAASVRKNIEWIKDYR
jgi:malate/lactate dehydrogenase